MIRRFAILIAGAASAAATAFAASGCAAHQIQNGTAEAPAGLVIVSTHPATEPINASLIVSLEPGEQRFTLVDERGQAEASVVMVRETTSQHRATTSVADGDRRIEFLASDEPGNITLTAAIDHADHALTLFDPPLLVAPPALRPAETFESSASMSVVDVNRPQKQRERGVARRAITYLDDAIVRTPDGREHRVARIEIHFVADLRLADADEHTTLYVSREDGLIASDSRERITILGAFPRQTRRVLIRE